PGRCFWTPGSRTSWHRFPSGAGRGIMRGMAAITYDAFVAADHGEDVAHFDENTTSHASWAEFMEHWGSFCDQLDVVWRWDVLYDDDGVAVMRVMTVRLELGRVEAHVGRLVDVVADAVGAWLRQQWARLTASWAPVVAPSRRRTKRAATEATSIPGAGVGEAVGPGSEKDGRRDAET